MKKLLAILLVIVLVLTFFVGCGNKETGTDSKKEKLMIAAVAAEVGIPYFTTMEWGARQAAKDFDVDLYWTGPAKWDFNLQMPFIDGALALNPDGLVLVPTDDTALVTYVDQWMSEGLPVISVDVSLQEHVDLVGYDSNQYSGGTIAAEKMYEINGEGGVYLPVGTLAGSYTSNLRCKGFIDKMKEINPTAVILDTVFPGEETAKAAEMVSAAITGNPDLMGIFTSQSSTAAGASSAVREADKVGKVKIASFDADPRQVEDLKDGVFDILLGQDPYQMGYDAVANLAKYIRGETTKEDFKEAVVHYDMVALTRENVDNPDYAKFLYIEDLSQVGF